MNIRIVTDSTCDLPQEIVSQRFITVVPLHINVGEKTYLDGVDLTRTEFYAQLPATPHLPRLPRLVLKSSKKITNAWQTKARQPFYPFTFRRH